MRPDQVPELLELYLLGELSDEEAAGVEAWLRSDPAAADSLSAAERLLGLIDAAMGPPARTAELADRIVGAVPAGRASTGNVAPLDLPAGSFYGSTSGAMVAYLLAALILGAGAIAARVWDATGRRGTTTVAGRMSEAVRRDIEARLSGTLPVATVAHVANCRWAGSAAAAKEGEKVIVGRRYALLAGQMEIAFDTGARIMLEGPADFRVDSPHGGFLSRGRLWVRPLASQQSGGHTTATGRDSEPESDVSETVSLSHVAIIHSSQAIVSTANAEFDVVVDGAGTRVGAVSHGAVALQLTGDKPQPSAPVYLWEDDSAVVQATGVFRGITIKGPDTRSTVVASRAMTADELMRWVSADAILPGGDSADSQFVRVGLDTGGPWHESAAAPSRRPTQNESSIPLEWHARRDTTYRARFASVTKGAAGDRVLWGTYVVHGRLIGVRLNGRDLPMPAQSDDERVEQFGRVVIKNGFRDGVNEIEFHLLSSVSDPAEPPLPKGIYIFLGGFRPIH